MPASNPSSIPTAAGAEQLGPAGLWSTASSPSRSSGSVSRGTTARIVALLLAFVAGAAAMFGYDRTAQPARKLPTDSLHATPAILEPGPIETGQNVIVEGEADAQATEPPAVTVAVETPQASAAANLLRVVAVTEPAPGRYARLPLATSQAIAFVDVKPGDRIKKGWQVFSHWESPERLQAVKTELERTKKLLDVAKVRSAAAQQTVARLKSLQANVPAQELQDAETTATVRQGELDAAQLAVEQAESHFTAMEFEFTQAFVTSPIDGIVASVDVVPGERRQLSGPFRGVTVLDISLLYCRCLLDQDQLATLQHISRADDRSDAASVPVTVESNGKEHPASVVWIGVQADAATGLIPVLLEVKNPAEILRCGIQVGVCFRGN